MAGRSGQITDGARMGQRFWMSFLFSCLATLSALAGSGFLASRLLTSPPPKRFLSEYFEFQLPEAWACHREGTEWICRSAAGDQQSKEAIIILTMKWRGKDDSLEQYEEHLAKPQPLNSNDGSATLSEVRQVERRAIGNHSWVYGLHIGSEVKNYETHYFATLTTHLAILVTMSAHKDFAQKYGRDLENLLGSLIVYQSGPSGKVAQH